MECSSPSSLLASLLRQVSTSLLKKCAAAGMSLAEIANVVTRPLIGELRARGCPLPAAPLLLRLGAEMMEGPAAL